MKYRLLTILLLLVSRVAIAQEPVDTAIIEGERVVIDESTPSDTSAISSDEVLLPLDSLFILLPNGDKEIKSLAPGRLGHSPQRATMYAAILPGLGQIYNRRYWKLPFLYGGVAALCYSIKWNADKYKMYKNAYRDFVIGDPNNKSYEEIILRKTSLSLSDVEAGGQYHDWFLNILKNKKDYFRRYRDLSYFGLIGLYVVQIVDAAVDAHFFKFDVSDDLSLEWQPTLVPDRDANVGASFCITF